MSSKMVGSALLITGTAIGAGMLGIPLATASLGVPITLGLLGLMWLFSLLAGRILLTVTMALPKTDLHINRMALLTLGKPGQWVARACVLGLLFSLTVAYITGGSSLLRSLLLSQGYVAPTGLLELLFTVVLGAFIVVSTRATDTLNRVLMGIKALLFIVMIALCTPHVNATLAIEGAPAWTGLWLAVPVLFVSFGYHHIIPSLAQYMQYDETSLKQALLWGSLIPLFAYIFWVVITLGVIPRTGPNSFATLTTPDVGPFIALWVARLDQPVLNYVIQTLAPIALVTSFLGVTLGLFDFLSDSLSSQSAFFRQRKVIGLLTFGLPLLAAILYPDGFIRLLAFGGVFLAIMAFILPPLMAIKLKVCGKFLPILVMGFGVWVAVTGLLI